MQNINSKILKLLLFFLIYLSYITLNLNAKPALLVIGSDATNFPMITADYFAYDDVGNIIDDLVPGNFSLVDNNSVIQAVDVTCPPSNPYPEAWITLAFDMGISKDFSRISRFELGKQLLRAIIDSSNLTKTHIAVCSFDNFSYLNQDFTNNREELRKSLDFITHQPGSIMDEGFFSLPGGILPVSLKAPAFRSVILITEGQKKVNADSIINEAKLSNTRFFCISLSSFISDDLKRICKETGGFYFSEIDNEDYVAPLARTLLSQAFNYLPCRLTMKGIINCDEKHKVTMVINFENIFSGFLYDLPAIFKPQFENSPPFVGFSAVPPNTSRNQDITLTAKNGDITISKFSFSDPNFTITAGDVPPSSSITVLNGQSHTVTVTYSPKDSAIVYTPLIVESNACNGNIIFITGGYPNTPPKTRTVHIKYPPKDETIFIDDSITIAWEGLLPADVIQLEYSLDSSKTWDTLATDVVGLDYRWKVPNLPSNQCMIRAIQLWPNNIGETKDFIHKNMVNSGDFNRKDGTLIVTSCSDKCARIWNSNTGKELMKFAGHTGEVTWSNFDPTEKKVVTASADSTVKIWDVATGSEIRTLIGHTDLVSTAVFSPDGSEIASSSFDGTVILWNANDFSRKYTFNCGQNRVRNVSYDPTGKYIITSGANGSLKLWETASKSLVHTFNMRTTSEVIDRAGFSPEGDKIVASTWYGRVYVWSMATMDTLYTVRHADTTSTLKPVFCAGFYRTGTPLTFRHKKIDKNTLLLISSGIDGAIIWDGLTGSKIANLIEHRGPVKTAVFNFDCSRVLTASSDSTAKIWNLDKRGLQIDTTGVFTIDTASVVCPDVDFGRVATSTELDSTVSPYILNEVGFKFSVKDIKITGLNKDNFFIIDGISPYLLEATDRKQIRLGFRPGFSGQHTADVTIQLPGREVTRRVTGNGFDPGLLAVIRSVDFGEVETGDFHDTIVEYAVKNVTGHDVKIKKLYEGLPDNVHFNIIKDFDSTVVSPGQVLNLKLRFTPEYPGRKNGIIFFEHDAEGSPTKLLVYGEGISPLIDTLSLFVPEFTAKAGETIDVPVKMKSLQKYTKTASTPEIITELVFNGTMLYPIDEIDKGTVQNGLRRMRVKLPAGYGQDSVIKMIRFKVTLGNDTVTNICFTNSYPTVSSKIRIQTDTSVFRLQGTCQEGGLRLFEPDGRLNLLPNSPNPTSGSTVFSFEILEPRSNEFEYNGH